MARSPLCQPDHPHLKPWMTAVPAAVQVISCDELGHGHDHATIFTTAFGSFRVRDESEPPR